MAHLPSEPIPDSLPGTARTVACALEMLLHIRSEWGLEQDRSEEVWYRGQPNPTHGLAPGIFRDAYDETALFHHFRVLAPDSHQTHRSVFDWLCLMQHHGAPTRLLDWTENFMVALYFAVCDQGADANAAARDAPDVGKIFLLAPIRLNAEMTGADTIFVSDGFHVALRAALARARSYSAFLRELESLEYFPSSRGAERRTERHRFWLAPDHSWLRGPVAVRPHRFNERILAQVGTFTLHGGKRYGPKEHEDATDRLPPPLHIGHPECERYLRCFSVKKTPIREQLAQLGIHEGTLFPELAAQAKYLKHKFGSGRRRG